MQPRISIIVPCYNGEKYLRETLDCLQKQTIEDWECIIVNDGSTDGSLEIMREYAAKDSRYKYIDKINEGPSVARNTAIAASSGKYILPLDADDLIAPTYAEKAINYLEEHDDCKLVYCRVEYFGDRTGEWELEEYSHEKLLWRNMIFCSAIYRRSDFDDSGGYNEKMRMGIEDWDFWLTLLKEGDRVYKIPEVLFYYRQHGESRTDEASRNFEEMQKCIVNNHAELYAPYVNRIIGYEFIERYYKKELQKLLESRKYQLGLTIFNMVEMIKKPMNGVILQAMTKLMGGVNPSDVILVCPEESVEPSLLQAA